MTDQEYVEAELSRAATQVLRSMLESLRSENAAMKARLGGLAAAVADTDVEVYGRAINAVVEAAIMYRDFWRSVGETLDSKCGKALGNAIDALNAIRAGRK